MRRALSPVAIAESDDERPRSPATGRGLFRGGLRCLGRLGLWNRNPLRRHQRLEEGDGFRKRITRRLTYTRDADAPGEVECGPSIGVLHLEVGAVLGEELYKRREAALRGTMQCRLMRYRIRRRHLT